MPSATSKRQNTRGEPGKPLYGPAARRAREAALDRTAAGSRAAKFGLPEMEAAAPVEPTPAPLAALRDELAAALAHAGLLAGELETARATGEALAAELAAQTRRAEDLGREMAERDAAEAAQAQARTQHAVRRAQREAQAALARKADRHRAAEVRTAAEPPPPVPPVPPRRGRVDETTNIGALLVMAPPRPAGHAGHCFAELLERQARRTAAPLPEDFEPFDPRPRTNPAAEDLRALACLYREAEHFYADVFVTASGALPLNGNAMRASLPLGGGSIAGLCVEMGA